MTRNKLPDSAKKKNAIVLYRFPNKKKINVVSGEAIAVSDLSAIDNGFIISSFDGKKQYVILDEKGNIDLQLLPSGKEESTKEQDFKQYVEKIKRGIKLNKFSKVVAARTYTITKPKDFHPITFFEKALHYTQAFVCLVFIENELCWCCASPELLLQTTKAEIETYSLAGTLKDTIDFSDKEKEEQAIVTRSIADTLASFKELKKVSFKTKVIANGTLNHLLTHIQAKKKRKLHWHKMALALHPTPAVGGFPKQPAIDFIKENEHFDRSFYSGFLGEIKNGNAKLYVNLRCMEATKSQLIFYAGCGITAGSDPKKEWMETNHKIDILKSLLVR